MEKSEEEWLQMNVSQRQDQFVALMKLPLQSSNPNVSDPVIELSEDYSSLLNKGIHESTLQGMWKKAAKLVTTDGVIVPIPGEKNCLDLMVASHSGQVPHVKKGVFI